jgi:hypothetical protein
MEPSVGLEPTTCALRKTNLKIAVTGYLPPFFAKNPKKQG